MKVDVNTTIGKFIEAYFDRYGPASIVDASWSGLPRWVILNDLRTVDRELIALRTSWTGALTCSTNRFEECRSEGAEEDVRRRETLYFSAHEDVALKA